MGSSDVRPEVEAPPPGTLVGGRFRLGEPLGRGGMGVVVAAHDEVLGRAVVIKLLARADAPPLVRERFLREARAAAALDHPHVVRALDVGEDAGAPFLVLEHLIGDDLRAFVGERREVAEVIDLALQACAGLGAVHASGFVHRDVKPANLFLARERGEEVLKVLDFGIAKHHGGEDVSDLTATGVALGSPRYMAPEQIRDAKSVDARADLWSLGVVLFEALAGQRPFDGESAASIGAAVVSDDPPDLRALRPDLPEELVRVVERCLAKNPSARFPSARTLAEALAPHGDARAATRLGAVLASQPVLTDLKSPERRLRRGGETQGDTERDTSAGASAESRGDTPSARGRDATGDAIADTSERSSVTAEVLAADRRGARGSRSRWIAAVGLLGGLGLLWRATSAGSIEAPPSGARPEAVNAPEREPLPGEVAARATPTPAIAPAPPPAGSPLASPPPTSPSPPIAPPPRDRSRRAAPRAAEAQAPPSAPSPGAGSDAPPPATPAPRPTDPLGAGALVDRK